MNERDLFSAIGNVGDDLIEKNACRAAKGKPAYRWKAWIAAVLALALLAGSFGGYAIAVEAADYREAVSFFEENELSADGLSREEIKAVYHDIRMNIFSYEKTAFVLNTLSVERYSVDLGALDRESLSLFWANRKNPPVSPPVPTPSGFRYERLKTGYQAWIVRYYDGENALWDYKLDPSFSVTDSFMIDDGVLLYGGLTRRSKEGYGTDYAHALLLDKKGRVKWKYTSAEKDSDFTTAVRSGNEIALFGKSMGTERKTWGALFTLIQMDGTVKIDRKTETGDAVYYTTAVKIGDSYLVKSHSSLDSFSADGELTETKTYQDGDQTYHIYDMLYHDGRVFLSAQKSITFDANATAPLAIEMAYAEEWREAGEQPSFSGEKQEIYTNYFRSIFESALLVCDEDGVIHKVFTVPASRVTGRLETDANGNLLWHVLRLDEATPPDPHLSVLCIFGVVTEFDMTFDPNGRLMEKREVGTYTRQIILN